MAIGSGSIANGCNGEGRKNGGNSGVVINGGTADGASGSTSGDGDAGNRGIAIGAGSVADGNADGDGGGVALNGGHTHSGSSDAVGSLYFNPA
jgi:hypothetical protein